MVRGYGERQIRLGKLSDPWDLVIIGGGITGSGIFRLASGQGLKVLLLEQKDFAWGTSSRSGKLVHGGLRYLKQGKVHLTRQAVQGREYLLQAAPGLVEPLGSLFPIAANKRFGKAVYGFGFSVYDYFAGRKTHTFLSKESFLLQAPWIRSENLRGAFRYEDAQSDDARLVLRLILEGDAEGGIALNYMKVSGLLKDDRGQVNGVVVTDQETDFTYQVKSKAVINAAGVWADCIRRYIDKSPMIRPLRGSHLLFPFLRFPIGQAFSIIHPKDRRPIYVFPWEGITLVGTTDIDFDGDLDEEPSILAEEREYLLQAVKHHFPTLGLSEEDLLATFSGVRAVIGTGKEDTTKESRDIILLNENGLLTITGGKLTTFRVMALEALEKLQSKLSLDMNCLKQKVIFENAAKKLTGIEQKATARRLTGRYGKFAQVLIDQAAEHELELIPGTPYIWAEIRHALRNERVIHLDDLLLRRIRIGLLLPSGGTEHLERIKSMTKSELNWDDERWNAEVERYVQLRNKSYR